MKPLTLATTLLSLAVPLLAQDKPKAKADKIDFKTSVLPILEKNCFECHRTAYTAKDGKVVRPKKNVVFDSKDGILQSWKGKLVIANKPDDSEMIKAVSLPADDDDRMPPKKKGDPLPKDKIEVLQKWIEQGADFGDWKAAPPVEGSKPAKPGDGKGKGDSKGSDSKGGDGKAGDGKGKGGGETIAELQALGDALSPLGSDVLQQAAHGKARIEPFADGSALLRVSFPGHEDEVADTDVDVLLPLREHVVSLDLGRTRVSDSCCAVIAQMPKLARLDLRETTVGDAGVQQLAACRELRSLNLFATKIGDAGMAALRVLPKLQHVYVWQTGVGAESVVALRTALPELQVSFAIDLPDAGSDAGPGRKRRGKK